MSESELTLFLLSVALLLSAALAGSRQHKTG